MSLFSPIWYPPRSPNVEQLAKDIELRMWAKAVTKMNQIQAMSTDLRGMVKRLGELKVVPNTGEHKMIVAGAYPPSIGGFGFGNVARGDYFSNILLPWAKREMLGPDPFDYHPPVHVRQYLGFAQPLNMAGAKAEELEKIIQKLANGTRLDWSNVP